MGTSCCWRNWLSLSFHIVLLYSATALKIRLAAFLQKSCGQNPPRSWQSVNHHLQQGNTPCRFFSLVIVNLDHFNNLFYNLAAQREGARTALKQTWEGWLPSWEQRKGRSRSAAFRLWYLTRAKLKHFHSQTIYWRCQVFTTICFVLQV